MPQRLHVGVAVGVDCLAAACRAQGKAMEWRASLAHDGRMPPPVDVLRSAFANLHSELPTGRVSLAIAILPPLARLRRIEMPRMTEDECRLAVTRSAERHFVDLGEPVICAVERRPSDGAMAPFLAAAVSAAFVKDLECIVSEWNWRIDRIVPAHAAWLVAAKQQTRELRRGDGRVVVTGTVESTVLMVQGGALSLARRLRVGRALPEEPTLAESVLAGDTAQLAARCARFTQSLELVPDAERAERLKARRRVARAFMGMAVACFVATAGVYRWGLSHQLDVIEKQRAAIHVRVRRAVAERDTLDRLVRSVGAIQSLDHSSTRWSAAITRIAMALPREASLITLRAVGDSVILEGQSDNAAATFAALRSTPGIVDVHTISPIRQELTVGQMSMERWTVALRVARRTPVRQGRK